MPSFQSHLSCNLACSDSEEKLLGIDEVFERVVVDSPESLFDLPPESFWVPKGSEQDWFHQNANMQRRTSMKLHGRSSSGLNAVRPPPKSSSLIALPKSRNSKLSDRQNQVTSTRLFRSLSEPGGGCGGVVMHVAEPVSPKVSCTGKVRSKKEGGRRTGLWKRLGIVLRSRFVPNRVVSKRGGEPQPENKIRRQSSL